MLGLLTFQQRKKVLRFSKMTLRIGYPYSASEYTPKALGELRHGAVVKGRG